MTGVIAVDKPQSFTSFDVVAVIRGCFHTKKVGHGGTLDPMATGVLPIFIGGATKAVDILPDTGKSYRAGFMLGVTSDTLDIWGRVEPKSTERPTTEQVRGVFSRFIGETQQIPPMYSALKVNGQKLCDLARRGIEVERKPRPITITRLELVDFDGCCGVLEMDCSSGTYVRSLIDDVGRALGTGAVMTSLVRTKSCGFTLAECTPLARLRELPYEELCALVKPVDAAFAPYTRIDLDAAQERLYMNGVRLDLNRVNGAPESGMCRIYTHQGFVGVARAENGELVPVKRLVG